MIQKDSNYKRLEMLASELNQRTLLNFPKGTLCNRANAFPVRGLQGASISDQISGEVCTTSKLDQDYHKMLESVKGHSPAKTVDVWVLSL